MSPRKTTSTIPAMVTFMAGCLICIGIVFINVAAQASSPAPSGDSDALATSTAIFQWAMTTGGFIAFVTGILYGFFKKQKYENLETDRNEWKGLAESREERIKELKYTHSESDARAALKVNNKETEITNLQESNGALVSQSLQMKAILRDLRLSGTWQGHEDRIHETK